MLRLDSSEMLPGSQKGENRGLQQKSWIHTRGSAILTPATRQQVRKTLERVMITWHREM